VNPAREIPAARGRVLSLVALLLVTGVPAFLLRASCVGRSCEEPAAAGAEVPFCSLPDSLQTAMVNGFRADRSPDLFVVDGSWPAFDTGVRVPLIFAGAGVVRNADVPAGTTLDRIAPTVASILGFNRTHPDVRSGTAIEGIASGDPPRLVVEVVWKRGDSEQLRAAPQQWPFLRSQLDEGAGSLDASPASIPLDPVAVMTTIGTGGMPFQHGIPGRIIRSDSGRVVPAWGRRAPTSIIATLGDDLDEAMGQRPLIGLLRTDRSDRGLIGGDWYIRVDRDDVVDSGAARVLHTGYGDDDVPDLMVAVVTGSPEEVDRKASVVAGAADEAADGSVLFVFTATGGAGSSPRPITDLVDNAAGVRKTVDEITPGGLFLNQARLAEGELREDEIIDALMNASVAEGRAETVEIFSDTAITFSRYC
jgi:hypothetical protein